VRLAQLAGRQAPCNAKMCEIMAKHTKGHRFTGLELRKALGI
jgi:hypothetical protein